jgi:hypothetical protein
MYWHASSVVIELRSIDMEFFIVYFQHDGHIQVCGQGEDTFELQVEMLGSL